MAGNNLDDELAEGASEEGFDLAQAKEIAGFVAGSWRRHRALARSVLIVCLSLTALAVVFMPRTYESGVKILAQRNFLIPALDNPGRSVPREADNPTRDAADTIMKRDNLVALVKQLDLVDRWHEQRPPALRAKDWLLSLVGSPPTPEGEIRALTGYLEKQITVATDDNSIDITVLWPSSELAYELASALQKNFVEARYDSDIAMIDDALAILEDHAKTEHDEMGVALADLDKAFAESGHTTTTRPAPAAPAPALRPVAPTPAASAARADGPGAADVKLLEEQRAAIKQIETARDLRVADLQRQLDEALGTYAAAHPTVIALKQRLEEAKKDPPELASLRAEETALATRVADAPAGSPRSAAATAPRKDDDAALALARLPPPQPGDSAEVILSRMRLQNATVKYTDLESRIDSAKIELDVTRAAFKYRFNVVSPAEVPLKAKKPNIPVLGIGGLLASVLLAFAVAVAKDMAGGRFVEPWQVERRLRLPLLGEIDHPSAPAMGEGPPG